MYKIDNKNLRAKIKNLFLKTMVCFSGCLMSSASLQKLSCGVCSALKCSFEEFVREKVIFPSYSSAIFPSLCLDFQAEDRLTPRWHVGQPCGKASWESLEGKPSGKATDSMIQWPRSVTLLLQLGRKAHLHAPTRDEDCLPWGDFRSTPRSMSALSGILRFRHRIHTKS